MVNFSRSCTMKLIFRGLLRETSTTIPPTHAVGDLLK